MFIGFQKIQKILFPKLYNELKSVKNISTHVNKCNEHTLLIRMTSSHFRYLVHLKLPCIVMHTLCTIVSLFLNNKKSGDFSDISSMF